MAQRRRGILEELVELPWWASVVVAAIVYVCARWIVPWISSSQGIGRSLATVSIPCAPYLASLFLLPAPFAVLREWKDRRRFRSAADWSFVQQLSWQEFESFLASAYRRLGYDVEARGGVGADGGIDMVLKEPGKTTLVQCKHWNRQQVGVGVVREVYGVMNAETAEAGAIVTGVLAPAES